MTLIEVMPQSAALAEGAAGPRPLLAAPLTVLARALTVLRLLAALPFAGLLLAGGGLSLALLFGAVALSDWLDGKIARLAGTANARWGIFDAMADVTFTCVSLAAAAYLGHVGPWVPAGVAALGGRFLVRTVRSPALVYDGAGNLAGVFYYALVGLVVAEQWLDVPGAWFVARVGDAVFVYTVFAWSRNSST